MYGNYCLEEYYSLEMLCCEEKKAATSTFMSYINKEDL